MGVGGLTVTSGLHKYSAVQSTALFFKIQKKKKRRQTPFLVCWQKLPWERRRLSLHPVLSRVALHWPVCHFTPDMWGGQATSHQPSPSCSRNCLISLPLPHHEFSKRQNDNNYMTFCEKCNFEKWIHTVEHAINPGKSPNFQENNFLKILFAHIWERGQGGHRNLA